MKTQIKRAETSLLEGFEQREQRQDCLSMSSHEKRLNLFDYDEC